MTVTKINTTLRVLTIILGIATVLVMSHVYALLYPVQAAALNNISDTLTTSAPSVSADHAIAFTMPATLGGTYDDTEVDQFNIYFDDNTEGGNNSGAQRFDLATDAIAAANITLAGTSGTNTVADDCTGAEAWSVTVTQTRLQFDSCALDGASVLANDAVTVDITGITNPSVASVSYPITITFNDASGGAGWEDEGETRVMILDQVTMTAEVETNLTCYVAGLADGAGTGGGVNGETLSSDSGNGADGSASATAIDFGVITPNDAAGGQDPADKEALGQRLEVATNAANGFLWTIEADARLASAIGADIDLFADDAATATPSDWANPTGTIAAGETGWGHLGLTSEDNNLEDDTGNGAADDFTDSDAINASCDDTPPCYVGNYLTARNVFAHTGPADGDGAGGGTADQGLTEIAWAVEVSSLQEAAADYNNTWTHICTPTF